MRGRGGGVLNQNVVYLTNLLTKLMMLSSACWNSTITGVCDANRGAGRSKRNRSLDEVKVFVVDALRERREGGHQNC